MAQRKPLFALPGGYQQLAATDQIAFDAGLTTVTPTGGAPASLPDVLAGASDAEATAFTSIKLPAVARVTSMLKATGVLSLTHLGCIGDVNSSAQKTINTNALNTIFDDTSVRQALIPPGFFYYNPIAAKTISRGFQLSGCGTANSQLYLDSDQDGIVLTQTDALKQITVNGFSMANASTTGSGRALSISYPATTSGTFPTVRIFDFATLGIDIFNHAWGSSISLSQAWNAKLGDLHLTGARGTGKSRLMKNAIIGVNCTGISISRFKVYYSTEGVVLGGGPAPAADTIDEGFNVYDFEIVNVDRGIYHSTAIAHAGNGISGGHINADRIAIDLYAKHSAHLSNLELYKLTNSTQAWTGINLTNCNACRISDILFVDSSTTGTGACNGIGVFNSNGNDIHDVQSFGPFAGGNIVTLGSGSSRNRIHDIDAATGSGGSAVLVLPDAGLYNSFKGILPAAVIPFAANAATPSVGNDVFGAFATSNTAATTITNFTSGNGVQRFTLVVKDGFTTIQHNSSLIMRGGVSVTPPAGAVLDFILDGSTWREVSRNF
jgi:hypothetical protein